jgi:hypothetical protein
VSAGRSSLRLKCERQRQANFPARIGCVITRMPLVVFPTVRCKGNRREISAAQNCATGSVTMRTVIPTRRLNSPDRVPNACVDHPRDRLPKYAVARVNNAGNPWWCVVNARDSFEQERKHFPWQSEIWLDRATTSMRATGLRSKNIHFGGLKISGW